MTLMSKWLTSANLTFLDLKYAFGALSDDLTKYVPKRINFPNRESHRLHLFYTMHSSHFTVVKLHKHGIHYIFSCYIFLILLIICFSLLFPK